MFVGVTGEPGSGKSAYGVDYVLNHKDEYRNVYININGFKLNLIHRKIENFIWGTPLTLFPGLLKSYVIYKFIDSIHWGVSTNIKPFNFPSFREIVSNCKDIYDGQIAQLGNSADDNVIDAPVIEYLISIDFISKNPDFDNYRSALKERKRESYFKRMYLNIIKPIKEVIEYKPTLFLIDEAKNHFPAVDPLTGKDVKNADHVLSWLVSYHRHLYMDVFLFTQNYQDLHIAYRRNIGYFLDGIESQSLIFGKFSSNFVYNKHKDSPYSNKNKTAKVKVKKSDALFDSYESGDRVRTKSVLLPWFIFAGVLLVVAVIAFSFVISSFTGDAAKVSEDNKTSEPISIVKKLITSTPPVIKNNTDYSKFTYLKFKCIYDMCINTVQNIELNVDDINATVTNTQSKILTVKKLSSSFGELTMLATEDFINLFQGAKHVENKSQGFSLIGN